MNKVEDFINATKLNDLLNKKEDLINMTKLNELLNKKEAEEKKTSKVRKQKQLPTRTLRTNSTSWRIKQIKQPQTKHR